MDEVTRVNRKCYANKSGNKCRILVTNRCPGVDCSFFKTADKHKVSCENAKARLSRLGEIEQIYIADKYYGGKKVWKKGGE